MGGASLRGIRVLLIGSLALNLLFGGMLLGAFLRPDGPVMAPPPRPAAEAPLAALARALPPAERRAILGEARDRRGDRGRDQRETAASELAALLRADPFDPAAVSALIEEQARSVRESEAALRAALVERLGTMTPAERLALAERVEAEARRGGRR